MNNVLKKGRWARRGWVILLLIIGTSSIMKGQKMNDSIESNHWGIIRINLLETLFGEYRVAYEQSITRKLSLEIGAGYINGIYFGQVEDDVNGELDGWNNLDHGYKGYSLRGGLKYYFMKDGIYITPLVFYKNYQFASSYTDYGTGAQGFETIKINTIGLQILTGCKYSISRFIIDLYLGLGYRITKYRLDANSPAFPNFVDEEKYPSLTPQFGFTFGYKIGKK